MSEWQNKRDFEINKAVAWLQSLVINEVQSASLKVWGDSVLVNDIVSSWEFNPCKNWSDGGPIISENKISLVYMCDEWEAHALENNDEAFNTQDKNPLRAAMIVYLEMKGVKP